MKRICLFIISIICIIGMTACQPTPNSDAVVQKSFNQLLKQAKKDASAEATPLRKQIEAPFMYNAEIANEDGSFVLTVKAQVEIPNSYRIPIVRIQPIDFSQEQVSTFFDYFCSNKEMYYTLPTESLSRSQIESYIRFLSQEIAEMEENGKADNPYTEQCRIDLQYYQSIYLEAPEKDEPVQCFGLLRNETVYSEKSHISVCHYTALRAHAIETILDNEWYCPSFSVMNRNDLEQAVQVEGEWFYKNNEATLYYYDNRNHACGEQCPHRRIVDLDEKVKVSFSPRQAENMVDGFLRSTGLENEIGIDSIWLYQSTDKDSNFQSKEEWAYEVRLSRIINDIPCAFDRCQVVSDYMDSWQYEQISLYLDDKGIFLFEWFGPIKQTEMLLEDVNLLPFQRIMELFEAHVNRYLIPDAIGSIINGDFCEQHYNIDRITLSMQRISEPNVFESALLIPVWSFYGTISETYQDSEQEDLSDWELSASLITINAIDGSIIDLSKGY